jgi:hypothetical protein
MTNHASKLKLLERIIESIDTWSFSSVQIGKENSPFVRARITDEGWLGFRKEAAKDLRALARLLFTGSVEYRHGTTFKSIYDQLSNVILAAFWARRNQRVTASDLLLVEDEVTRWFRETTAAHELYVPCFITPRSAASFAVGPVKFTHIEAFIAYEQAALGGSFDKQFGHLIHEMQRESAHWMATITVSDCTLDRAWELGEMAVDIALVAIQVIVPFEYSQHVARITARTRPRLRETISRSNGQICTGRRNQSPGLLLGDNALDYLLGEGSAVLKAIGPRVSNFIGTGNPLPKLEAAWADAAYWFHEGLAEPLDTIAVSKLETAIEVLLQNSGGSASRLEAALFAFYGLTSDDPVNSETQVTAKQFARGIVEDRSRVLHGNWSTLTHFMPESRETLMLLVADLLVKYAAGLNDYIGSGSASDGLSAFLRAVTVARERSARAIVCGK